MSSIILGTVPTFHLSAVDPGSSIHEYYSGGLINEHLPTNSLEKIKINGSNLAHTSQGNDDIHIYRDRYNVVHTLATTNCHNYQVYMQDGTAPTIGGICKHCRCQYGHLTLGIPIRLVITASPTDPLIRMYIFYMDDTNLCSFECAKAYVQREVNKGYQMQNPFYIDSVRLLERLFNLMYPYAKELMVASTPSLMVKHGGSLTVPEHRDVKHHYRQMPNIETPPAKFVFEKSK